MARYEFKLPDIGEGIAEAEIVAWHVKVGDTIKEDQPLVDVMTEKAENDFEEKRDAAFEALTGAPGFRRFARGI